MRPTAGEGVEVYSLASAKTGTSYSIYVSLPDSYGTSESSIYPSSSSWMAIPISRRQGLALARNTPTASCRKLSSSASVTGRARTCGTGTTPRPGSRGSRPPAASLPEAPPLSSPSSRRSSFPGPRPITGYPSTAAYAGSWATPTAGSSRSTRSPMHRMTSGSSSPRAHR